MKQSQWIPPAKKQHSTSKFKSFTKAKMVQDKNYQAKGLVSSHLSLPAFKIVKYFWWSSLFVISIVPQLFVNVAILLVFNKENEILGFYWVQQTSLVYPHVGIHPWGPLSIL